ncbi:MAG: competence/damage-inducible protein A [Acidobacteria bacterium]|nr:competence/damage-inducible protein A [Acidobacteriota bacterium]
MLARRAAILAVGSELLTPTKVDTNSLAITEVLNALGIEVAAKAVVGDAPDELAAHIRMAVGRHAVVVITGGLGPTEDDLTRDVVATVMGRPLVEDPALVEQIRERFTARGLEMPESNRRQGQVPEGSRVIPNTRGSAPGLWLAHDGGVVILLPGPPSEMRPMLEGPVREWLIDHGAPAHLIRRVLRVAGRTESGVDAHVHPLYMPWAHESPSVATTILASAGVVELHLSAVTSDAEAGQALLHGKVRALQQLLGDDVVSVDGRSLSQVVGDLLRAQGATVTAAESCTGGLLTALLTDVPGSSDYVDRTAVVYSNEAKREWLGVSPALVDAHGAVSGPVARAMATGALAHSSATVAVAITGIAGPGGGTIAKPVGTVWFALAHRTASAVKAVCCRFAGDRAGVRRFAALTALDLLRRHLLGVPLTVDWRVPEAPDA